MGLENGLFEGYFANEISRESFVDKLNINNQDFPDSLYKEIETTIGNKDSRRLEYLIYALMVWAEKGNCTENVMADYFLESLNELVLYDWHKQHENIAELLQKIADEKSVEPLYKAIYLKLPYLEWDDNFSFQKKCVRIIGKIGGENAVKILENLCNEKNMIICEIAQRKLMQLKGKK